MTDPRAPSYCVLFVAADDGALAESERVIRSVAPSIRRVPPDRVIDVVRGDPTVAIVIIDSQIAIRSAAALDASLYALEPTLPVLWVADGSGDHSHFPAERTLLAPLPPQ